MLYLKRLKKDYYKRKTFKEKQFYIFKLKSLINNQILPFKTRFYIRQLLHVFVRKHGIYQTQIINKCLITGRSRGIIKDFQISRIVFKKLADNGDLSWVKKIMSL